MRSIIRTILMEARMREPYYPYPDNWTLIGCGSEGEVFSDGTYAYKVVRKGLAPIVDEIIAHHTNKHHENVVTVYDAWEMDDDLTVIKMELLKPINLQFVNRSEFRAVGDELCELEDKVSALPKVIGKIRDPEIKKMVTAIYHAGLQMHMTTMDIGFHNLMFDPVSKQYKQIDIF